MKYARAIFDLFKEAAISWSEDQAHVLAAALAYYTIFSLSPLLILAVTVAGLFLGEADVQEQLLQQVRFWVSSQVADTIELIIGDAAQATSGVWATIVSIALGFVGSSIVFRQLKMSLNAVWNIAPEPGQGLVVLVKRHVLSFLMVLLIGFLLLILVAISTGLRALGPYLDFFYPDVGRLLPTADLVVSFLIITGLFAMTFKILPDAQVAWRDVWLGAAVTSLLFTASKYLIAWYLANLRQSVAFGAATSFVTILLWVYFAAQIFLFGAEFTQVYANKYGSKLLPSAYAMFITRQRREPEAENKRAEVAVPVEVSRQTADSAQRQFEKQVAAAMLGLAVGLFIAFWNSLKRS
ncbi:MAG TPA: YihY/virulence factor BrkB family protein [Anaerolineae bacterium]